MYYKAQGRAVAGSLGVVGDVLAGRLGIVLVAETLEDLSQLFLGEEEEQHQGVCLFGELVPVRVIALGLQDTVEPLDVVVLLPIGIPVKLLEVFVALELADDAVVV